MKIKNNPVYSNKTSPLASASKFSLPRKFTKFGTPLPPLPKRVSNNPLTIAPLEIEPDLEETSKITGLHDVSDEEDQEAALERVAEQYENRNVDLQEYDKFFASLGPPSEEDEFSSDEQEGSDSEDETFFQKTGFSTNINDESSPYDDFLVERTIKI